MMKIILDASVLLDIMVAIRQRRQKALPLFNFLQDNEIHERLPSHAFIELASGTKNEQLHRSPTDFHLSPDATEEIPLEVRWVAIDAGVEAYDIDGRLDTFATILYRRVRQTDNGHTWVKRS